MTTLIGYGSSPYATRTFDGPVPLEQVHDLFNFTAEFAPVFTMRDGLPVPVPGRNAVVRTDTQKVLNVASKRYGIHQFSEVLLDNVSALFDTNADLDVISAGLTRGGAVGWVQVKAPDYVIAGDVLAPTVTVASSHDGSLATSYRVGTFRFMCSNQVPTLRQGGRHVYKVKHTRHSVVRLGEARNVVGLMFDSTDEFSAEVNRLIDTTVTDQQFEQIIETLHRRPADGAAQGAVTRWENRRDALRTMWAEDERVAPYRGTAWGAMQAFSTWQQWERPMRGAVASSRGERVMSDYLGGRLDGGWRAAGRAVEAVTVG